MIKPVIFVRSFGGLGNRMFRYMFADFLSRKIGGLEVIGFNMPEWKLVSPVLDAPTGRSIATGRVHKVDVEAIIEQVSQGAVDWIDVDCFAMRLEYFRDQRDRFARVFSSDSGQVINDGEIAIHIRVGDIIDGAHPDYTPIPIAYYHRVVFETGLKPVFIGQLTGNWYGDALAHQFKHARFVEKSEVEDFQTIRRAKNAMMAVSSFSWLATYLSDNADRIHYPVAGLLNPKQRPDVDLLPVPDSRYRFHHFPIEKYTASIEQTIVLGSAPAWAKAQRDRTTTYMGLRAAGIQPPNLSVGDVADRISSAAEQGRPFCMLRLGDGEGSLLRLERATMTEEDAAYFRSHFGDNVSADTMLAVKAGLERTIDAADVIGVRDDIWLSTQSVETLSETDPDFFQRFLGEFPLRSRERSQIDEHGARRVFRLFQWAQNSYPVLTEACSQWVCYDLAVAGFWSDFLRRQRSIGLVHCSPTLPTKIAGTIGVSVDSFIVPDKAVQRGQWANVLPNQPPHFPDAFLRVCDQLNKPARGKVFLVGAGLAGKEYLRIIKDNGGIALDLGALLDVWDDRATRPQIYAQKTGNQWSPGDPVPPEFLLA